MMLVVMEMRAGVLKSSHRCKIMVCGVESAPQRNVSVVTRMSGVSTGVL